MRWAKEGRIKGGQPGSVPEKPNGTSGRADVRTLEYTVLVLKPLPIRLR